MFLVRDWSFPYEAEYGFSGGQRILNKRLEISPKQPKELQQLREHIKSSFENIKCFLMPHPGLEVAINPEFRGELNSKYKINSYKILDCSFLMIEISADFISQLHALAPHIFDRNNLMLKTINGQQVTCRELVFYFNVRKFFKKLKK